MNHQQRWGFCAATAGAGSGVSGVGDFLPPRPPPPPRAASPHLRPAEILLIRGAPSPDAGPSVAPQHSGLVGLVLPHPTCDPSPRVSLPPHVAQPPGQSTPAFRPQAERQSPGPCTPAGPSQSLGVGPGHLHFTSLPSAIPRREVWGPGIPEPAVQGTVEAGGKGARPGTPHSQPFPD